VDRAVRGYEVAACLVGFFGAVYWAAGAWPVGVALALIGVWILWRGLNRETCGWKGAKK